MIFIYILYEAHASLYMSNQTSTILSTQLNSWKRNLWTFFLNILIINCNSTNYIRIYKIHEEE